jgi:hypothetical protein
MHAPLHIVEAIASGVDRRIKTAAVVAQVNI